MLILPSANQVFFRAVSPGYPDSGAKIDTAYVEFSNGPVVPSEDVLPATLRTYFDSLASTEDRDYLRLPVGSHKVEKREDGTYSLTMSVATDGATGVHGKTFASTVGSRVYAVTLVSSQHNDRDDIFIARHHYVEAEQLEKPDNGALILSLILT